MSHCESTHFRAFIALRLSSQEGRHRRVLLSELLSQSQLTVASEHHPHRLPDSGEVRLGHRNPGGDGQHPVRMSGDELNPAAVAQPVEDVQGDGRWISQHTRFVQECKDAEPDVLFVGDSMIQLMQQYEVWRELFSPLHALNFGIGGDTTCNVLWRLQNGELENIRPKVVVLWVGTNNYEHTAEQVAGGILAIAELLTSCLPKAKIVVLGLLPRGERPNPLREKNAAVNGFLRSWLPRLRQAQLLDVSGEFVHSDGAISPQDMFDFLHLTSTGYRKVSKPLSDLLLQILEETPEERRASLV